MDHPEPPFLFEVPAEDFDRLRDWIDDHAQQSESNQRVLVEILGALRQIADRLDTLIRRTEPKTGG